jgi:hypothetical protein
MNTLPLPPRPSLEQYRKRAKELVTAAASNEPDAVRDWGTRWLDALARHLELDITPFVRDSMHGAVRHIERRVRERRIDGSDGRSLSLGDAQAVIAQAHGFTNWAAFAGHVQQLGDGPARGDVFEAAADAVVGGDLETLDLLLRQQPELLRARSARIHRATLLHYVAANGVEDFRQRTPPNAVAIARRLLEAGAEVDALAETYGGGTNQTTLSLLVSSDHPAAAGLQAMLVNTLVDFGAALNGVANDSAPLMTAVASAYPKAAQALADRGARVDNVIAAAALGRLDLVGSFVLDARTLAPGVSLVAPSWYGLPGDPKAHIERAFVAACKFGRLQVVDFLLQTGVDHAATDGLTGLHWAAGHRYLDVVRLLLARGAALEAKNAWGGTVLDSTVWFAKHPPIDHPHDRSDVGYLEIIEVLLGAGADVSAVRPFPTSVGPIDTLLRQYRDD